MRTGGTIGIIGVLIFVLMTAITSLTGMLDIAGSNVYISVGYSATLRDLEGIPSSAPPGGSFIAKMMNFVTHIVVPILFIFPIISFKEWFQTSYSNGLCVLGIMGLTFWILCGLIRVLLIPAVPLMDEIGISQRDVMLLWLSLSHRLFDGAYLLIGIHALLGGTMLWRTSHRFSGNVGMTNGIAVILIILASPFKEFNGFSILAYGSPIMWFFGLSSTLLVHSYDKDKTNA